MSSNKHTPKSRLLILLLILELVISAIPLTSYNTLTVYAEYNGSEGTDTGPVGTGTIGASTTNTAFYIYVVDWTGLAVTPGVLVMNTNSGIKKKWNKIQKASYLTKQSTGLIKAPTDLVGGESMTKDFSDAPYPVKFVNGKWESNGNEIRGWLLDKVGSNSEYRFLRILRKCISEKYPPTCEYGDVWGMCEEDLKGGSYHVMVQPVAMLHVKTTYERLMTTDGWIRELGNYQHPLITGAMYNCMITEFDQLGIKAPTEIKASYYGDYEKLKTTGYIKTKPHTNNFRYT